MMSIAYRAALARGRLSVAAVVATFGVGLLGASDARAAGSPWSVRADESFTAAELGAPARGSDTALGRAAIERSTSALGLSGGRLGAVTSAGSFGAPGADARVMRFRQSLGGLRVLWSQINVTVGHGSVAGITGTVVPLPDTELLGAVRVTAEDATETARSRISGDDTAGRPELVAYAGEPDLPRVPRRAYVVEVTSAGDEEAAESSVVIDAETGDVLKVWRGLTAKPAPDASTRTQAAQSGQVLAQYADAKGSASTALPFNGYDLVARGNPYSYDLEGADIVAFGTPTPLNSGTPPFRTAIDTTTEVARFFCVKRSYCGRDGGGTGTGFKRHFFTINWGGSPAMYKSSQERIYIPKGDASDWETAAHELGHSMDHHGRDEYLDTFEGQEVKEALAEMFSYDFSFGRLAPPGGGTSISTILKDPRASGVTMQHHAGSIQVKLPSQYWQYYCNTTEEHLNGYILGHAYYKLVQRVGRDLAGLLLTYVPWQLPAKREFGDVREALEDAAHALFPGPNNTEGAIEQHVDEAFDEVGVQDASRRTDRCPGANP